MFVNISHIVHFATKTRGIKVQLIYIGVKMHITIDKYLAKIVMLLLFNCISKCIRVSLICVNKFNFIILVACCDVYVQFLENIKNNKRNILCIRCTCYHNDGLLRPQK